jgi:hypothetical protein
MNKHNRSEIDGILLDVRKSYRTLYSFQRMVLDLAKYIGDRMSFTYSGGYPVFSSPSPRPGKGHFNCWAWDWLNMYHYEFHYAPRFQPGSGLRLSVEIISDTGYWLSQHQGLSRIDLDRYELPEHSGTKLLFIIGKDVWKPAYTRDVYDKMKSLLLSNEPLFEIIEDGSMLFQVFDLADFLNAEDTDRQLSSFIATCGAHGITLPPLSERI